MNDDASPDPIGYPPIPAVRKAGEERLHCSGRPCGPALLDFWRWSASDLLSNATRGIFAEYIVAAAFGLAEQGIRDEWGAYDLKTPEGVTVEVKSAAYIQSWHHDKLSQISFGIRPIRAWDPITNDHAKESRRQAQVYVFCLLDHRDQATIDPLNLDQWRFLVLATSTIEEKLGSQKTIGLTSLLRLDPHEASFEELAEAVRAAAARLEN